MTTGFTVATILRDGKVGMVYGYADGYLDCTGRILVKYYKDFEKTRKLINLGELECIGRYLEPSEQTLKYGWSASFNEDYQKLPKNKQERLQKDDQLHVSAFHRDRGEQLRINTFDSIPQYLNFLKKNASEFNYFQGYSSEGKPQWNLILPDGFYPLVDDKNLKGTLSNRALNLAELDDDQYWNTQASQKKALIIEFLRTLGQEFHLGGRDNPTNVTPFYFETEDEERIVYYDPVSYESFLIKVRVSDNNPTLNFTHTVLAQVRTCIKNKLKSKLPLYSREELSQLEQLQALAKKIASFYRTKRKEDPNTVGFNYLVALCQDEETRVKAKKEGYIPQQWELEAESAARRVKPYVQKKIKKLFDDLKKQQLDSINLSIKDICKLTSSVGYNKVGYYDTKFKYADYKSRLVRGQDPTDPAQFADPLLTSKLYFIVNKLYEQVTMKDTEHKLEQAIVLANGGNN